MKQIVLLALLAGACVAYAQDQATADLLSALTFDGFNYDKIVNAVDAGADVNYIDPKYPQHGSVLRALVMITSGERSQALHTQQIRAMRFLMLHGARLPAGDPTILYLPIANGDREMVVALLELGADAKYWPNELIGDNFGMSPIQVASERGFDDVAVILVQHGAPKLDQEQVDALQFVYAAVSRNIQKVLELLDKGVHVNYENPNGQTALMAIVGSFKYDQDTIHILQTLLDKGADANQIASTTGLKTTTPLNAAVFCTSFLLKSDPTSVYGKGFIDLLIASGAYISGVDLQQRTPLHIAAQFDNIVAANILVENDCKIQPKDMFGKTPLDYAKSSQMIRILKAHGARE